MTSEEWVKRLIAHVLRMLQKKWDTRCKIVSEAKHTLEKQKLIDEAETLWKSSRTLSLLAQDRYLMDDNNKPSSKHSAEELRNWIKTRKLAVDAAQNTVSKGNSTLHTWLQTA